MNKYLKMIVIIGLSIPVIIIALCIHDVVSDYKFQKEMVEMQEDMEEFNRKLAIMELSELKGRVKEIEYISLSYATSTDELQEKLISELESIRSYDVYFRDFEISISLPITPSNIGDICENIISQIDNEIHTIIMYEGEDA